MFIAEPKGLMKIDDFVDLAVNVGSMANRFTARFHRHCHGFVSIGHDTFA